MRKQDHLIQLIASLSPGEKRYFKLFSNIEPGEKRYLKLFDALEKMQQYDAAVLCKQLNLKSAQLADDKYYLNQALLNCLRNYDEENTPNKAIRRHTEEAALLINRRQFDYALEIAEKALEKVAETQAFEFSGQLLNLKYLCLHGLGRDADSFELLAAYVKAAEAAEENFELRIIMGGVMAFEQKRILDKPLHELLKRPILKKDLHSLQSLVSQTRWLDIKFRYLWICKEYEKALEVARMEVEHFKRNPQIKMVNPVTYVVAFTRVANALGQTNNLPEALKVMQQFDKAVADPGLELGKTQSESLKAYSDLNTAHLLRRTLQFDEALVRTKNAYARLPERPVYEQYAIINEYALTLFALQNSTGAAAKLEELIQLKEDVRLDLQPFLRPLIITVQLDLENYPLIPYLIKSAKSWMKRNKITFDNTDTFFSLTYAIAKAPVTQRRQRWLKLQQAIEAGKLDNFAEEFNLRPWVAGKLGR